MGSVTAKPDIRQKPIQLVARYRLPSFVLTKGLAAPIIRQPFIARAKPIECIHPIRLRTAHHRMVQRCCLTSPFVVHELVILPADRSYLVTAVPRCCCPSTNIPARCSVATPSIDSAYKLTRSAPGSLEEFDSIPTRYQALFQICRGSDWNAAVAFLRARQRLVRLAISSPDRPDEVGPRFKITPWWPYDSKAKSN
jgi:hypothetical protein